MNKYPKVGLDTSGPWREDREGQKFGYPWNEITRVTVAALDLKTHKEKTIEFDHESGHFLEMNSAWVGFTDVIEKLSDFLPVKEESKKKLKYLEPTDDFITLWVRADYPQ
ncbi:hypothetical protein QEH52_20015 [Coraliomargarita sp. SDUM461003]|uniref:Uncharacterized protein n=1 Tax=Thalassobacterium maritimum TaxID=3041265 RepID=A0ABU1B091_9BACT|nr:hypothetical protein [Coraliomargarita sp. SDUM461003]MDQ8209816.1 hypothetical protein [Coraliomargarita sp. SDUM461003]